MGDGSVKSQQIQYLIMLASFLQPETEISIEIELDLESDIDMEIHTINLAIDIKSDQ